MDARENRASPADSGGAGIRNPGSAPGDDGYVVGPPGTSPAHSAGPTGWLHRHPVAARASAIVLALALAGAAAVFAGKSVGGSEPVAPVSTSPSVAPSHAPPPEAARPTADERNIAPLRTCSVADLATDESLGTFYAHVRNAETGDVLFDRRGDTPARTASVLKMLTSAAALAELGPDYRATTTVVRGTEPGSIVLVGGGDVTLSRTPSGNESVYDDAPHLDDLARQTKDAWEADPATAGTPITSLVLDSSYFGDPAWQPSWERKELYDGFIPEITALQVDGDRESPYDTVSARSEDPVGRAGVAFAELFGGLEISRGTADAGAQALAEVSSAPVGTLVKQTLIVSDNAIAEMLARLTAISAGSGNTFADLQQGLTGALDSYAIDTGSLTIVDGSGLSDDNAVAPSYVTQLLRKIDDRDGNLGYLFDGLPIAGETGSLAYGDRFTGDNEVARGSVFAKTGWIDTGYTLAGIIRADDGTTLTFAVYALDDVDESAKQAIDTITTGFFRCGNNLSNH